MKSKEQILLEEAYDQIRLKESEIPNINKEPDTDIDIEEEPGPETDKKFLVNVPEWIKTAEQSGEYVPYLIEFAKAHPEAFVHPRETSIAPMCTARGLENLNHKLKFLSQVEKSKRPQAIAHFAAGFCGVPFALAFYDFLKNNKAARLEIAAA
jgi:hypothetical protein